MWKSWENLRKFAQDFHMTFYERFSLNFNNSANIDATAMKHIPFCSQEQDLSFYLRNTLVENRSTLHKSWAKLKKRENLRVFFHIFSISLAIYEA